MNSELADTLGNLLSRACAKVINAKQVIPPIDQEELEVLLRNDAAKSLVDQLKALPELCAHHYDSFNVYLAVDEVIKALHSSNKFVEVFKPWELRKDPKTAKRLDSVLGLIFESLRITSIILQPVIPALSSRLLDKISVAPEQRSWRNLDLQTRAQPEKPLGGDNAIMFKRIK